MTGFFALVSDHPVNTGPLKRTIRQAARLASADHAGNPCFGTSAAISHRNQQICAGRICTTNQMQTDTVLNNLMMTALETVLNPILEMHH